ncbi:MAG TPA: YgiQ family radical SAM protein [Spirochaetia bacterium]|nr:MAG: YgiQ family radical SAM protein [Spirochaetes bacterium GWB1_36_13]HCL56971.1 YgiQ family radical SAM protein [Spirochaetia bacterium]
MFLPVNLDEMKKKGWEQCDFILVTPDAYVDHPSFAMAVLGRFLEKNGYKVGILSQPGWQDPKSFLSLGEPRLAWGVSGGNVDSMVLNYTANKKRRMEDEYSENGNAFFAGTEKSIKNKIRPDHTVLVYTNAIRQISKNKPIIIGGLEASLRRLAHYDHWSESVKRSILFDAKADILGYGMGEYPLLEILQNLEKQIPCSALQIASTAVIRSSLDSLSDYLILPSYEEVKKDKKAFGEAYRIFYENKDQKILVQKQDTRYLVQFPRREMRREELDQIYDLPFERNPHPVYKNPIPAFDMIKESVTSHRGCFGNCSFCSITFHQGSKIISRTPDSVLNEVKKLSQMSYFHGAVSDIGGPSANMYASYCKIGGCASFECLNQNGKACRNLVSGIQNYSELLKKACLVNGVKHVFIGSGLRFDPVLMDEGFLTQVIEKHTSGQLKIAPESGSDKVLKLMKKPAKEVFEEFKKIFDRILKKLHLRKRLIPYIIIGHPGEGEKEVLETLSFLKKNELEGNQFQIFTPSPMTLSSTIYYLGYNPLTGEEIKTEKQMRVLESAKKKLVNRNPGKDSYGK